MNKQYLQEMAETLAEKLPDGHGFLLLAFPFDKQGDRRVCYVSNGQRADCIAALKEWLFMQGENENWMNHIN